MSNSYFRFKQFTIHQEHCAMKVGTDGVLLGAWVSTMNCDTILDIGTGTGLIALMLAQRCKAKIDAIEIDAEAATQAKENVALSPWKQQIQVFHTSLQEYSSVEKVYDLVVSNPPFFSNALPAPCLKRNVARHNSKLTLHELLEAVNTMIKTDGRLGIILPPDMFNQFVELAKEKRLFLVRNTMVKPSPHAEVKRVLAEFSRFIRPINTSVLVIEKYGRHKYSEEYIALTKDFYLKF